MAELRVKSTGTLKLFESDNTSSITIASPASLGADRTVTLPDADVTLVSGTMSTGFAVADITGQTALAEQPASDDEIIMSDAGTLKRLDIKHIQNTPSFLAYQSGNMTLTNTATTKVPMDAEVFDTDGTYDHSTNYRWTPGVAGKYWVFAKTRHDFGGVPAGILKLYKNGAAFIGSREQQGHSNATTHHIAMIVESDADDYFEVFAYQNSGGDETINGGTDEVSGIFGGFRLAGM